jgi:polyferredoxin
MGFFPSIRENLVWYLLLIGIPVITFAFGKNIYCFWLCPFGAVQELTAKLGGGKYKCRNKKMESKAKKIKYILFYIALLGAFLMRSPGFAGFEPFSALFSQQGTGIQWLILPLVLFTSLFIYRFWCRYFCPVWVANEVIWKLSRYIKKGVNEWKKKNKALEK